MTDGLGYGYVGPDDGMKVGKNGQKKRRWSLVGVEDGVTRCKPGIQYGIALSEPPRGGSLYSMYQYPTECYIPVFFFGVPAEPMSEVSESYLHLNTVMQL